MKAKNLFLAAMLMASIGIHSAFAQHGMSDEDKEASKVSNLLPGSKITLPPSASSVQVLPPASDGQAMVVVGWKADQQFTPVPGDNGITDLARNVHLFKTLVFSTPSIDMSRMKALFEKLEKTAKSYSYCLSDQNDAFAANGVFSSNEQFQKSRAGCKNAKHDLETDVLAIRTEYSRAVPRDLKDLHQTFDWMQKFLKESFQKPTSSKNAYCNVYFKKGKVPNNGLPTFIDLSKHRGLSLSKISATSTPDRYDLLVVGDPAIESIVCFNVKNVGELYGLFGTGIQSAKVKKVPTKNFVVIPKQASQNTEKTGRSMSTVSGTSADGEGSAPAVIAK